MIKNQNTDQENTTVEKKQKSQPADNGFVNRHGWLA
jgi:hypothetical protein